MKAVLARLKSRATFLETEWFGTVSWVAAIVAPLPLATQLWKALTAVSVEGIAIEAYSFLCILHAIMALRGLKALDPRIMVTFVLTSLIAGCIAIATFVRGGTLLF
jgi:hypothetical protein